MNRILTSVQPEAKRTVEGDLGVYINRRNILDGESLKHAAKSLAMNEERLSMIIENLGVIPETEEELQVVTVLTSAALKTALKRHAGIYRDLYGERGRTRIAEGKDLTAVKFCIGTGGALTRTGSGIEVMKSVLKNKEGKTFSLRKILSAFWIISTSWLQWESSPKIPWGRAAAFNEKPDDERRIIMNGTVITVDLKK